MKTRLSDGLVFCYGAIGEAFAIRIAILLCQTFRSRQERGDLILVIAHLHAMVIDDDGAFEDGRILLDECNELRDGHRIEIDVILLNDFRAIRDDVIGAVFGFDDDIHEILALKLLAENIHSLIRDLLVIEPLLHFAAARA